MEVDISAAIFRASTTTFPSRMDQPSCGKPKCRTAHPPPPASSKPSSRRTSRSSSPGTSVAEPQRRPSAAAPIPSGPRPPCLFGDLTNSLSSFTFDKAMIPSPTVFSFPAPPASSSRHADGIKRPRPPTDVDGPNTACLGSKKRRLRRHLITSRLSQPFCQPASHILNREAVACGDKRFLKLAAIANARRIAAAQQAVAAAAAPSAANPAAAAAPPGGAHHPGPSEVLRRAAIINRFRLRMCVEASQRGHDGVAVVAANAGLLQLSGTGLQGLVGTRFPAPSPAAGHAPSRPASLVPALPLPDPIPPQGHPHPLSRAAATARPSPPGAPTGAAGLPGLDGLAAGPRLPSPVLGPLRRSDPAEGAHEDDDVDDDDCAFPTSEHESRYEPTDDPDDVYADFSVIFGGGGSDVDSDEEGYEEFMDDVDGIPYTAR